MSWNDEVELTGAEKNVLLAARDYADALAVVLKGKPPFSTWDAARLRGQKADCRLRR